MKAKRFSKVLDPHWWRMADNDQKPPDSAWILFDVDEHWKYVRTLDLETELIHQLTERHFWRITFNHMNHGLGKGVFKNAFFTPEAEHERSIAIHGLTQSRRSGVMELITATRVFHKADRDRMIAFLPDIEGEDEFEFQPTPLLCDEDGREWDAERIAQCFAYYILSPPPCPARKGPKSKSPSQVKEHPLRTLALHFESIAAAEETLERRNKEPAKEGSKKTVGLPIKAKMWRVFCKEVVKTGELPNPTSLKEAMQRETGTSVDPTYFKTMCNSLGLSWIESMK